MAVAVLAAGCDRPGSGATVTGPAPAFDPATDRVAYEMTEDQLRQLDDCLGQRNPLNPGDGCSRALPRLDEAVEPDECERLCLQSEPDPQNPGQTIVSVGDTAVGGDFCATVESPLCDGVQVPADTFVGGDNRRSDPSVPAPPGESQPGEPPPGESETAGPPPVESQPVESQPAGSQPAEPQPESAPPEEQPGEEQPEQQEVPLIPEEPVRNIPGP
ncbi:hypothetical protein [Actinoplanes sp. URMC 104]|uniref:hypothetical protein n=1 Tax=Actinoplanes sp. URMC 104 TaxID=3423409 RepID=UPI003F1D3A6D